MLRAVVFDMDDTLIDWSERGGNWAELHKKHLRPMHDHLRSMGHAVPNLEEFARLYRDQTVLAWQQAAPPEWDSPRQIEIIGKMLEAINIEVKAVDLERLQRLFDWQAVPGVRVFKDAVYVLRTLREAGLRTGLVTNAAFPMWMRDTELRSLGLLEYLDVRLTAADVGKLKPHPHPFKEALRRLGVEPGEAIFVGDRLHDDVLGAQGVGMRAVWVRRGTAQSNGSVRPNATIDTLSDLLKILDMWFPGWRKQ
jgi:HAD superfamily hydrolase (TIGR01509 family)